MVGSSSTQTETKKNSTEQKLVLADVLEPKTIGANQIEKFERMFPSWHKL